MTSLGRAARLIVGVLILNFPQDGQAQATPRPTLTDALMLATNEVCIPGLKGELNLARLSERLKAAGVRPMAKYGWDPFARIEGAKVEVTSASGPIAVTLGDGFCQIGAEARNGDVAIDEMAARFDRPDSGWRRAYWEGPNTTIFEVRRRDTDPPGFTVALQTIPFYAGDRAVIVVTPPALNQPSIAEMAAARRRTLPDAAVDAIAHCIAVLDQDHRYDEEGSPRAARSFMFSRAARAEMHFEGPNTWRIAADPASGSARWVIGHDPTTCGVLPEGRDASEVFDAILTRMRQDGAWSSITLPAVEGARRAAFVRVDGAVAVTLSAVGDRTGFRAVGVGEGTDAIEVADWLP